MRVQHWFYTIPLRLRSIFRRRQVERDLDEELQYHLDKKIEELLSRGLDPAEARKIALRAMDGLTQRKEECRDARRVNLIDNAIQDLRYGVRVLAKAPGFTAVAVLTLALGIGANTAIFSVIDAVLLKPLNLPDPDRVVQLMLFSPAWKPGQNANAASLFEFNIYRERREVFDQIAAYDTVKGINLTGIDPPEQLRRRFVSFDYFSLFGAHTVSGRTFTEQEDRPGGPHVAVISQALRNRRFASEDPIGKVLALGDDAYTVIGVLDTSFVEGDAADLFLPLQADPLSANLTRTLQVSARLKPGVTLAQAKAALRLAHEEFVRRVQNLFPNVPLPIMEGYTAEPLRETIVGESRRLLLVLAGAVGLVLLIACANVANLLIARNTGRKREIAVRTALGAGRGRIASQLLAESLLLSLSGGALGLLVGTLAIRALMAMRPGHIPRIEGSVALNPSVLLFTLVLAISTGLLFGMAPALTGVTRLKNSATLIAGGVRSGVSRGQKRARSLLVIAEIALALVLLTGAGLLIRTFWALRNVDPGFDAHNVLTMEMSVEGTRFETPAALGRMIENADRRLRNLPGVVAAAAAYSLPLYDDQTGGRFTIEAHPDDLYSASFALVSKGYFDVFRIPLREGRFLNEWDDRDSPPVAIANEAIAKGHRGVGTWSTRFPWRDGSPIGERITIGMGAARDRTREIVGVVGAVRDSGLNRDPGPLFYLPISQMTEANARRQSRGRPLHRIVRARTEPYSLRAGIERELRAGSGGLPVAHITSMEEILSEATARDRFNMTLLCAFAAIALMLGAVGVYGVMAYSVQQRTQEIGVRIALGALPRDVRFMVIFDGMGLAMVGVVLGIAVALTVTPFMGSLLFGVEARDPAVFASTVIVLSTAALLATCIPAYRATRVDPVTALRSE
jgi:putative ABC transport system permease protein